MNLFQESIGWLGSLILIVTIGKQIYKQWAEQTSVGVSKWLFLGQIVSSSAFVAYSVMVHNWVFVATNTLLLIANFIGVAITLHYRRRRRV